MAAADHREFLGRRPQADVTLALSRETLNKIMAGEISPKSAIDDGLLTITGDRKALLHFFLLLDDADPSFPIVTPRSDSETAWQGIDKLPNKLDQISDQAEEHLMDHPKIARARDFIGELVRGC